MSAAAAFFLAALVVRETAGTPQALPEVAAALSDLEARFPVRPTNAAAFELERLASRLGINLAPPMSHRARLVRRARPQNRMGEAGAFAMRQAEAETDLVAEPPERLRALIAESAPTLDAITSLLSEEELPRWAIDVRRGSGPEPDLLGLTRLQKLLISRALIETRAGRLDGADRALEASWRLNLAMNRRPGLTSQIVAIAVARLQSGALRMGPFDAGKWSARMRFADLRSSFWASLRDDYLIGVIADPSVPRRSPEVAASIVGIRRVSDALSAENACDFTRGRSMTFWRPFFPSGVEEGLGGIAMPSLLGTAHRVFRLSLEAELTEKVLDARALRDASPEGGWPQQLADADSRVCPGARWIYSRRPDGAMTISFGGRFAEWPNEPGIHLPLSFTAVAPARAAVP
jgi:hypothetical protein